MPEPLVRGVVVDEEQEVCLPCLDARIAAEGDRTDRARKRIRSRAEACRLPRPSLRLVRISRAMQAEQRASPRPAQARSARSGLFVLGWI
jgi:hypothetical protein